MRRTSSLPTYVSVALLLLALLLPTCSTRYRMDLYYLDDGARTKIDIDNATFTPDTRLNYPHDTPAIVRGDRSTAVIEVGMRGAPIDTGGLYQPLTFDRLIQYRIYLELPNTPFPNVPDTIPLDGNSYVRLMGFYEQTPNEKLYLPSTKVPRDTDPIFVIDSVRSNNLYGTFHDAYWVNSKGDRIGFDGRLKMKLH